MPDKPLFISDPAVFYNILYALGAALIVSFAVTPLVRMLAHRVGAVDDPNRDDRRMHNIPMPRLGGLAIFAGFMISFFLFGIGQISGQLAGILIGGVLIVAVGAIDDIISLPWWAKLAGQLAAASVPVLYGLRVNVFTNPALFFGEQTIILGVFDIPVTVLWIVGITNAVNLIDGLDGLAAGVSGIASLSMLLIALATGNPAAALLTASLAGGCLGFLPYNFNPARLIMGDCGALFLGYILSCASILGLFKFYAVITFAVPFLILGLPIFDTTVVFIRRLAQGKNPLSNPDRKHVHHRLIDMGFSQKQAVAILYSVSAVLGLSAVVLTTSGELRVLILLITVLAAGFVYIGLVRKNNRAAKPAARIETEEENGEPDGPGEE
ncbi:MAG: undecaprenyl/decaprenyl-phosphate alpha-N-acetylglucosaminyl 1-phosphate transferase [Oscillospiraceae bacterium]|jgi:UDP-GlcNAc:undecaprenyl-phosphate GlcNAc-1-phosphate transferase|nr:undecaprenyl/decaprenyl-phosphate alpha-N-acetylglucosaminyl 1-phosphate transferase [Oscillospiraceae bacterium]